MLFNHVNGKSQFRLEICHISWYNIMLIGLTICNLIWHRCSCVFPDVYGWTSEGESLLTF